VLRADEERFVCTHRWPTLGLELAAEDFTDTEVATRLRARRARADVG
jgi:hypothetical protein